MRRPRTSLVVAVLAIVLAAVAITTASFIIVAEVRRFSSVEPSAVAGGTDQNDLLTHNELHQLLYDDTDVNKDGTSKTLKVSDWRYANIIRSLMSRPEPTRTQRLDTKFITTRHFSEV